MSARSNRLARGPRLRLRRMVRRLVRSAKGFLEAALRSHIDAQQRSPFIRF